MKYTEKTTASSLIYDGKIIKVFVDGVELDDGTKSKREIVRHTGGAAALFVKDGKVALVRQFRYAYGKEIYEIPAGKLEKGEDHMEAAKRELEEETGYRATKMSHLLDIYPSPGYTDEIIHVYFVETAQFVGERLDDGELLDCEFVGLDKVLKMIEDGEICDSKTVAAVYKYKLTH